MFLEKLKKYIKYKKMWHKIEKIKKISKYETKDGIQSRNYLTKDSYKTYLEHQKSKFAFYSKDLVDHFDDSVKDFKQHFQKVNIEGKRNIICLGSRTGAEVKALRELGHMAIGIDIAYPEKSPYTFYGDFHKIEFSDNTFDCVYSNCLDHVYDYEKMISEIKRVLNKDGIIIFDVQKGSKEEENTFPNKDMFGYFETKSWQHSNDIINSLQKFGLKFISKFEVNVNQVCAKFLNKKD